ncbi:MAG: hypothetical protein Q9O74_05460 [Planctomycetota bacterium]|nr:hypothetical protein [Planctomycetota bacterium]
MARSHICMGCGKELARLRAPPDPHYGLPVVVCPGCGLACVRRPRGGLARWHTFLRALGAGLKLVGGGMLLVAVLALGLVFCAQVAEGLDEALVGKPFSAFFKPDAVVQQRLGDWWTYGGVWIVPVWGVAWLSIGLLTGVFFPHWRVRWWLVGMAGLTVAGFFIPTVLIALDDWVQYGTPPSVAAVRTRTDSNELASLLLPLAVGVGLTAVVMPFAQTAGQKRLATKGLRSKRLTRTRRKRSREQ